MSERWVSGSSVRCSHAEYNGKMLHKMNSEKPMFENSGKRKCSNCVKYMKRIHEVGYDSWLQTRQDAKSVTLGWQTKARRDKITHKYVAPLMMRLIPVTCPACGRAGAVPNKTKPSHHCTMCKTEVILA